MRPAAVLVSAVLAAAVAPGLSAVPQEEADQAASLLQAKAHGTRARSSPGASAALPRLGGASAGKRPLPWRHQQQKQQQHHQEQQQRTSGPPVELLRSRVRVRQPRSQVRRDVQGDGFSSANCSWVWIEQPLTHFNSGAGSRRTYRQRVCIFDGFWGGAERGAPIFFYTGNESPVEEYVNNTGLMWTLASKLSALIVFAEHRYFGESVPKLEGEADCLAYLTSAEALADYADLAQKFRDPASLGGWGASKSALVAFGGSYGGMLAAWFRMKYPSVVQGAIAASAPILGFPMTGVEMSSASRILSRAATAAAGLPDDSCYRGLKAAWVFLHHVGGTAEGRAEISQAIGNLCKPLESPEDVSRLLGYLKEPLFNLAEGDYPFSTDYISFALSGIHAPLPPWPFSKLCDSVAPAAAGVALGGDEEAVKFSVQMQDVMVSVDWNEAVGNNYSTEDLRRSGVLELLAGVSRGVQVWYNATGLEPCVNFAGSTEEEVDVEGGDNANSLLALPSQVQGERGEEEVLLAHPPQPPPKLPLASAADGAGGNSDGSRTSAGSVQNVCQPKDQWGGLDGWYGLCCNDPMNLLNTEVSGTGRDLFWPPNVARNFTLQQAVKASWPNSCAEYFSARGYFGTPLTPDPWARWLQADYGGRQALRYASNIVFSNGELDPWTGAGVTPDLIKDVPSLSAPLIKKGGHHLDLFFPDPNDPESAREVRLLEERSIQEWIQAWSG